KGKCDVYDVLLKQTLNRPLDNVMKLYLPNFQYLLHYSDIHLCIIDQIKVIQTQLSKIDNNQLLLNRLQMLEYLDNNQLLLNRLQILEYLCISTETSGIIIQCCKQGFRKYSQQCADLFCKIAVKLNERQLDDVLEFFINGIGNENTYQICVKSLAEIALDLNYKQLNRVFQFLMDGFENENIKMCSECAHILAITSLQLGEKQLGNTFQYLMNRFYRYFYYADAIEFIMKLKEGQTDDLFKFSIVRLRNKSTLENVRGGCAEFLGKLSMKWSKIQLNNAFISLMEVLNDETNEEFIGLCAKTLGIVAVKLDKRQFNHTFEYLIDRLKSKNGYDYFTSICLLEETAMKLNGGQ
ncbi:hypothetical protein RFI_34826, partial [Reticulomyxa filosa]